MPGSQSQSRLELVIAKTVQLKTLRSKTNKAIYTLCFPAIALEWPFCLLDSSVCELRDSPWPIGPGFVWRSASMVVHIYPTWSIAEACVF